VKKFLSVSKSYISDLYQAEDCLIKAFCKILSIESFRGESNLESWARRIVVNECLNFIKSHKTFYLDEINQSFHEDLHQTDIDFDFNAQELLISRMLTGWFSTSMFWKNIPIRKLRIPYRSPLL
jgi:RNA polymerase sigma-70 factor (ECF subfamily)